MEKQQPILRICQIGFIAVFALLALFYWLVEDSWSVVSTTQSFHTMQQVLPSLENGDVVEQRFIPDGSQLQSLALYPSIPQPINGSISVQVMEGAKVLAEAEFSLNELTNMEPASICFDHAILPKGQELTIRLQVLRTDTDGFLSLYYGDMVDLGRYQVASSDINGLTINGEPVLGHLDCSIDMMNQTKNMSIYLFVAAGMLVTYLLLAVWTLRCQQRGKRNIFLVLFDEFHRYRYLIERLVSRDFNTKYRQSILGVLWSFLNPLLTMLVYYIVFSTVFKNNIPNFPVYLLTGIVMFNYFSEATGMGLESITCNASLITKVYVPKYIYPLSRVCSSLVNLLISLIPLLIVVLLSGARITRAILLLPIPILSLAIFSLGMSLLLATSNVFFRDTKFLWSVLIMMWNFLTPIFYPESIIPASLTAVYHMNPLYQFIYFVRCILLEGVTPQPVTYLYCILCAVVPLALGLWIFRKNQNKFVLYL